MNVINKDNKKLNVLDTFFVYSVLLTDQFDCMWYNVVWVIYDTYYLDERQLDEYDRTVTDLYYSYGK